MHYVTLVELYRSLARALNHSPDPNFQDGPIFSDHFAGTKIPVMSGW